MSGQESPSDRELLPRLHEILAPLYRHASKHPPGNAFGFSPLRDTVYGKTHEIRRIGALYWTDEDAILVKLEWPDFKVEAFTHRRFKQRGKYVAGELYRTIAPRIIEVLTPDDVQLIVIAAHGCLHPIMRGLGTVLEEAWGIPTIGVARKLLVGTVSSMCRSYYTRDGQEMIWRDVVVDGKVCGGMAEARFMRRYISPGGSFDMNELPVLFASFILGATVVPLFIAKKCYALVKGGSYEVRTRSYKFK